VDLNSCCNHLSYYTALSRSARCECTVIVQGFYPSKITCGASGYLQQEFRELELLDDISKLCYMGNLPESVNGKLCNALLQQCQQLKRRGYCPENVMGLIRWSELHPMQTFQVITDSSWQVINKSSSNSLSNDFNVEPNKTKNEHGSFIPAQGSKIIKYNLRRKGDDELGMEEPKNKKIRTSFGPTPEVPIGYVRFGFIIQKAGQNHFIHLVIMGNC